jgi:hypothetical protein
VGLVTDELAGKQMVLKTHSLRQFSGYTTSMRRELIDEIRSNVAPDAWGEANGSWVLPSRSIMSIDVFHTNEVQSKVRRGARGRVLDIGTQSTPGKCKSGWSL